MGKYDIDLSQHKCQYCGLYFPGYQIDSHEKSCHSNPDNQKEED